MSANDSFSALQRAENSSIVRRISFVLAANIDFQCSSASRKFLNYNLLKVLIDAVSAFSALQRAENSSISRNPVDNPASVSLSVLFSEPKIPQFVLVHEERACGIGFQCSSASRKFLNSWRSSARRPRASLSVLFSEPKIPQFERLLIALVSKAPFSALQRAENSSI